jgi:ribonuclease VapC
LIVDSTALVALLLREDGWEALAEHLAAAPRVGVGAPTLTETSIVLASRLGETAATLLARLITDVDIAIVAFGADHARVAVSAFRTYGKGRHPAALNFGDCMSYATAKLAAVPLLCVGNDFEQTDVPTLPDGT